MRIFAGVAGAVLSIALASAASAGVIYNNGGPATEGNETTAWVQAEDFSFGADTTVTGAGVYLAGNGGFNWDGNLTYFVFSDVGGTPGAVLQTGAVNSTLTDTGTSWPYGSNIYLLDFNFSSSFAAVAGVTYWLGIHASTDFNRDEIYWVTTASNGTNGGRESGGGTFNNWGYNNEEHAFYLSSNLGGGGAVPEPATWAMMILGFGGVGSLVRVRRQRTALA